MSRLRLKEIPRDDMDCTPHIRIWMEGRGARPCKLQQVVNYDADQGLTFWEWQDVEMVDFDTTDYEEQER